MKIHEALSRLKNCFHHLSRYLYEHYRRTLCPTISDSHLIVYRRNIFYYWIGKQPYYKVLLTSAGFLFLIPFILNLVNKSAFSPTPLLDYSVIILRLKNGTPDQSVFLPFSEDYAIIFFTLLLYPLHTLIVVRIWDNISKALHSLVNDAVVLVDEAKLKAIIKNYNFHFNRRYYNGIALLISIIPTVWIYSYARNQIEWWGRIDHGYGGFVAYNLISIAIWYQLLQHNLKGIIVMSLMRKIFGGQETELRPDIFHEDDFHGFACVEKIFALGYATTLIHIASLYLALHFHYITRDLNVILIAIIAIFVVFVPVFIVFPFFKLASVIKKYRNKEIIRVKKIITSSYLSVQAKADRNQMADVSSQELQTLAVFVRLYEILKNLKTIPFTRNRILGMVALYTVQISVVVIKLLDLIKNPHQN